MIVKIAAIVLLLGVCYALPALESTPVPVTPPSLRPEDVPPPPKLDDSDLKTDATTWWHTWYHYNYPPYYVHKTPNYYWKYYW